jgi:uncharacterized protein YecE (DUF72 family)
VVPLLLSIAISTTYRIVSLSAFSSRGHGIGFTDAELATWAQSISRLHVEMRDVFVYFNNDPDGHAIEDAFRLRSMLDDMTFTHGTEP